MSIKDKYKRHGGAYDRGMADSWYRRGKDPHFYVGASLTSERVGINDMSDEAIKAYHAGFDENEEADNHK